MNLKEAFRQQNLINQCLAQAYNYLDNRKYYLKVTSTVLYHKVDAELQDEVTTNELDDIVYTHFDKLVDFINALLNEREALTWAIHEAKKDMDYNIDVALTDNKARQRFMSDLKALTSVRNNTQLNQNGARGYKFNTDNEQVSFFCDVEVKTEPNFNLDDIKARVKELQRDCDIVSSNIDSAIINTQVNYEPKFNLLDGFMNLFEEFVNNSK